MSRAGYVLARLRAGGVRVAFDCFPNRIDAERLRCSLEACGCNDFVVEPRPAGFLGIPGSELPPRRPRAR
jgi:hypothetical protein